MIYRISRRLRAILLRRRLQEAGQAAASETRDALQAMGLDQAQANRTLNDALTRLGYPTAYDPRAHSVHWLLAAGLSQAHGATIKRILEFGTHTAFFTALLRQLFPHAEIVTLDLPDNDPLFLGSYAGPDDPKLQKTLRQRQENLARAQCQFLQMNSFFSLRHIEGEFDMVWIDAGHMFPEVAWDICIGYNLTKAGGFLLTDDVLPSAHLNSTGLVSSATWHMAQFLRESTPSETYLIPKRIDSERFLDPRKRKYVSLSVVRHPAALEEPMKGRAS